MFWPPQSAADAAAIRDAKRQLRRAVLRRRDVRPPEQRATDDEARFDQLRSFLAGSRPTSVACYFSSPPEPGTLQTIAWLASRGSRVLLPVITEAAEDQPAADQATENRAAGNQDQLFGEPDWAPYDGPDRLRTGRLSIIEPTTEPLGADAIGEAELIIVPGLAGNVAGDRLGRGGGWYDRGLLHATRTAVTALFLNDDEVLDVIPTHPWDRRVDVLITPTRVINCSG